MNQVSNPSLRGVVLNVLSNYTLQRLAHCIRQRWQRVTVDKPSSIQCARLFANDASLPVVETKFMDGLNERAMSGCLRAPGVPPLKIHNTEVTARIQNDKQRSRGVQPLTGCFAPWRQREKLNLFIANLENRLDYVV